MISARWYWLGLTGSSVLLAIAYFYFQLQLELPPCPLCIFQRVCLAAVALLCLTGIISRPQKTGSRLLALGASIFSALGLLIAGRQVWLQHLPADKVPECGPDLAFMLEAFPLMDMLKTVFQGSGECAEVQWQFLTLSMPEWMILVFVVMLLLSLKLLFIKERNYFSGVLGR